MKTFSFYETTSGLFSPNRVTVPAEMLTANTPPGFTALEGEHDHLAVQVVDGEVVTRTTPPTETRSATWRFDEPAARWVQVPKPALQVMLDRRQREQLVQELERKQARALRALALDPNDVAARERLRDIERGIVATGVRGDR